MVSSLVNQLRGAFEIDRHPLVLRSCQISGMDDFAIEHLGFETHGGEAVRGILTRPISPTEPLPALLYIHAHGNRHDIGADELLDGRPALQGALGPVFARAGFATLMLDLPTFGQRPQPGESSRSKAALWRGKSLAGQMLGEQSAALTYLAGRSDVCENHLGVFGISMGATLGYWLAAVDQRIACVMHMCCYADFAHLIETGAHDLHGQYLTIPGLLNIAGNGEIAGLVAPRPQLICIGDQDPLTPPLAVDRAFAQTTKSYARKNAGDQLVLFREPDLGHQESPAMRERMLRFAIEHLMGG